MSFETKFGKMNDSLYNAYCTRMVGKVYKLLPMKEENNPTLDKYIDSLLVELNGGREIIIKFNIDPDYLSLLNSIAGLKNVERLDLFRSKVFECITICNKLV